MTDRTPIIDPSTLAVKLVQAPLSVEDCFPDYRYEFQNIPQSAEAEQMFGELLGFIQTNGEIAVDDSFASKDDYSKGFQKALALTRLWMDTIYIGETENSGA